MDSTFPAATTLLTSVKASETEAVSEIEAGADDDELEDDDGGGGGGGGGAGGGDGRDC
jgi:hypothetical protein